MNKKILKENDIFVIKKFSEEHIYFSKKFNNLLNLKENEENVIVKTSNTIGILMTRDNQFIFHSKINDYIRVFEMIESIQKSNIKFVNRSEFLFTDSNVIIDLEEGKHFIEHLIEIFLNEIEKVENIGFTKKYEEIIENTNYLKGKLLINKHIEKNLIGLKFYNKYEVLNYKTIENNIILYTLQYILLYFKNLNQGIRKIIIKKINYLNDYYDMLSFNESLLSLHSKLQFNKANYHYKFIISISKMFLNKNFNSASVEGKSKFCNFLIKTDVLFEKYIFSLIKNLIDEKFPELFVKEQVNLNIFKQIKFEEDKEIELGALEMIPDIIVYNKILSEPELIIDTKFIDITNRNKISNYAYFQMISYIYSLKTKFKNSNLNGLLLSYGNKGNTYKVSEKNDYIFTEGINILDSEENLKIELENLLRFCLQKR